MRVIPTRVHGYLDYLVGAMLVIAPIAAGFEGAARWVPVILGIGTIIYSLVTDYELGVSRTISMRSHLALDFGSGALLTISPWLFGFASEVWLPHLVAGLFEILVTVTTKIHPTNEKSIHRAPKAYMRATRKHAH